MTAQNVGTGIGLASSVATAPSPSRPPGADTGLILLARRDGEGAVATLLAGPLG